MVTNVNRQNNLSGHQTFVCVSLPVYRPPPPLVLPGSVLSKWATVIHRLPVPPETRLVPQDAALFPYVRFNLSLPRFSLPPLPFYRSKPTPPSALSRVDPMPHDTPKPPGYTRFVCISDTHSRTDAIQMPYGDVFIHAGDFTELGLPSEVKKFNDWLGQLLTVLL